MSERAARLGENGWWDFWNTSYRAGDGADAIAGELFARTAAVVNAVSGGHGRVLEIGCGTGLFSRLLNCREYHGVDISTAAVEIARRKASCFSREDSGKPPQYDAGDFHDWPLPSEPFDVTVCIDAIAYFRDQQFAVEKMCQSLKSSGRLVLTTINPFVYHRIQRSPTQPLEEGSISRWLSRGELHALIKRSGFTIERSYSIMPRGNKGVLRIINSYRLNQAFGQRAEMALRRLKEQVDLGQYRVVVARKVQQV